MTEAQAAELLTYLKAIDWTLFIGAGILAFHVGASLGRGRKG